MTIISPDQRILDFGHRHCQDAHRDVLIAVQRSLAEHWDDDHPRIAIVGRAGSVTVYVSTIRNLEPGLRADIRTRARQALAEFNPLGQYADVVFLHRNGP